METANTNFGIGRGWWVDRRNFDFDFDCGGGAQSREEGARMTLERARGSMAQIHQSRCSKQNTTGGI